MSTQKLPTLYKRIVLRPYLRGQGPFCTISVHECTFDYLPQNKRDPGRDHLRVRIHIAGVLYADTWVASPVGGWRPYNAKHDSRCGELIAAMLALETGDTVADLESETYHGIDTPHVRELWKRYSVDLKMAFEDRFGEYET